VSINHFAAASIIVLSIFSSIVRPQRQVLLLGDQNTNGLDTIHAARDIDLAVHVPGRTHEIRMERRSHLASNRPVRDEADAVDADPPCAFSASPR
jgi:hypothetical protein